MTNHDAHAATQAATDAVQAMTDLVVHAALPELVALVEQAKVQMRRELRLHFGIVDKQERQIEQQRRTIDLLVQRLDAAEAELAHLTVDVGAERLLGTLRDEQIADLGAAHNAIVEDVRAHLAQLRGEADARDGAITEAESRIADLEREVFVSDQELAQLIDIQIPDRDRGTLTVRVEVDSSVPDCGAFGAPACGDRHCGCPVCCECGAVRVGARPED